MEKTDVVVENMRSEIDLYIASLKNITQAAKQVEKSFTEMKHATTVFKEAMQRRQIEERAADFIV